MVLVLKLSSHVSSNSSRHSSASLSLCYRCCSDVDLCFLTVEVYCSDVVQQEASLHRVHVAADSKAAGTQIQVHAVQCVSHSINCIDHKLNLPLLLVGRVPTNSLLTCRHTHRSLFTRSNHYSAAPPPLRCECTCTFLLVRVKFDSRSGQFTPEIIFPELIEPDVPAVVLQRTRREVLIEP